MKIHSSPTWALLLCLALLIWLGTACATFTRVAPAVDLTGTWKATVETPEGTLDVFLHIQKSPEGILAATIDVPIMDAYDVPLIFSFENDVVHYEVEGVQASFDGKLTDSSTIEGIQNRPGGEPGGPITYKRVK